MKGPNIYVERQTDERHLQLKRRLWDELRPFQSVFSHPLKL